MKRITVFITCILLTGCLSETEDEPTPPDGNGSNPPATTPERLSMDNCLGFYTGLLLEGNDPQPPAGYPTHNQLPVDEGTTSLIYYSCEEIKMGNWSLGSNDLAYLQVDVLPENTSLHSPHPFGWNTYVFEIYAEHPGLTAFFQDYGFPARQAELDLDMGPLFQYSIKTNDTSYFAEGIVPVEEPVSTFETSNHIHYTNETPRYLVFDFIKPSNAVSQPVLFTVEASTILPPRTTPYSGSVTDTNVRRGTMVPVVP